jgi:pimeloyl-ACP methyl ester carboxylesterase
MTTVFIHGVPDTARVWSKLIACLSGAGAASEAVALQLPGFGCERPAGFAASKEAYVGWLIEALEAIDPPRDVIAHDWGSILLLRVLSLRPDLIRSWVGGGAPATSDYTWHTTARIWQTEGAGEKAMDRLTPALAVDMLRRAGLPDSEARDTASHIDAVMKGCILALYRSGRDVFGEWEPGLSGIDVPGLVLWGKSDPYAAPLYGERMGDAIGSTTLRVLDCGHWWQVERPEESAGAVAEYWRSLRL